MDFASQDKLHGLLDPRLRSRLLLSILTNEILPRVERMMNRRAPESSKVLDQSAASDSSLLSHDRLLGLSGIVRTHKLLQIEPPQVVVNSANDPRKKLVDRWVAGVLALVSGSGGDDKCVGLSLLGLTCKECSEERFLESFNSWFNKLLPMLKKQQASDKQEQASSSPSPAPPSFPFSVSPLIQEHPLLRAACMSALADLLTRLGSISQRHGLKKDGAVLCTKVWNSISEILNNSELKTVWKPAIRLLTCILQTFPSSLRSHVDMIEAQVVSKMMDPLLTHSLQKECISAFSLLPRAIGDSASFSSLLRRLLIALHNDLSVAFHGLEDASIASDALSQLLPNSLSLPPPPLGRCIEEETTNRRSGPITKLLLPRIHALLKACYAMLTSAYSVPVPLPVSCLLSLCKRILQVDGSRRVSTNQNLGHVSSSSSVPPARSPFLPPATSSSSTSSSSLPSSSPILLSFSVVNQELLCADLPFLHSQAFSLLASIVSVCRSQMLPYGADVAGILIYCFKKGRLYSGSVKVELYMLSLHCLLVLGTGIFTQCASVIVGHCLSDLRSLSPSFFSPVSARTPGGSMSLGAANDTSANPSPSEKRKTTSAMSTPGFSGGFASGSRDGASGLGEFSGFNTGPGGLGAAAEATSLVLGSIPVEHEAMLLSLEVQTAVMEVLEAILLCGGPLLPDKWRSEVDAAVASLTFSVITSPDSHLPYSRHSLLYEVTSQPMTRLQLACCRTLLSSLLSPCAHRPPYLSQAMCVFRAGRLLANPELSRFCSFALLSLEPVLHPRCLPPVPPSASLLTKPQRMALRAGASLNYPTVQHNGTSFRSGIHSGVGGGTNVPSQEHAPNLASDPNLNSFSGSVPAQQPRGSLSLAGGSAPGEDGQGREDSSHYGNLAGGAVRDFYAGSGAHMIPQHSLQYLMAGTNVSGGGFAGGGSTGVAGTWLDTVSEMWSEMDGYSLFGMDPSQWGGLGRPNISLPAMGPASGSENMDPPQWGSQQHSGGPEEAAFRKQQNEMELMREQNNLVQEQAESLARDLGLKKGGGSGFGPASGSDAGAGETSHLQTTATGITAGSKSSTVPKKKSPLSRTSGPASEVGPPGSREAQELEPGLNALNPSNEGLDPNPDLNPNLNPNHIFGSELYEGKSSPRVRNRRKAASGREILVKTITPAISKFLEETVPMDLSAPLAASTPSPLIPNPETNAASRINRTSGPELGPGSGPRLGGVPDLGADVATTEEEVKLAALEATARARGIRNHAAMIALGVSPNSSLSRNSGSGSFNISNTHGGSFSAFALGFSGSEDRTEMGDSFASKAGVSNLNPSGLDPSIRALMTSAPQIRELGTPALGPSGTIAGPPGSADVTMVGPTGGVAVTAENGEDEDSDGPLPDIVDGDPDDDVGFMY